MMTKKNHCEVEMHDSNVKSFIPTKMGMRQSQECCLHCIQPHLDRMQILGMG